MIILIALAFTQIWLIAFTIIERIFFSLQFKSPFSLMTRANGGLTDWTLPIKIVLSAYLSLKPNLSHTEKVFYMLIIVCFSTFRLVSSTLTNPVLDKRMRTCELYLQSITYSYYLTNFLIFSVHTSLNGGVLSKTTGLVLVCLILAISIIGSITAMRVHMDHEILKRMSIGYKKQTEIGGNGYDRYEYGVYLIEEMLDSENPKVHMQF